MLDVSNSVRAGKVTKRIDSNQEHYFYFTGVDSSSKSTHVQQLSASYALPHNHFHAKARTSNPPSTPNPQQQSQSHPEISSMTPFFSKFQFSNAARTQNGRSIFCTTPVFLSFFIVPLPQKAFPPLIHICANDLPTPFHFYTPISTKRNCDREEWSFIRASVGSAPVPCPHIPLTKYRRLVRSFVPILSLTSFHTMTPR